MTAPDHAAAAQIVREAIYGAPDGVSTSEVAVDALASAGLLAAPGELAALRALADAAREVRVSGAAQWLDAPLAALDALPPTTGE